MTKPHITILGGGMAGLSVGYYAKKNGLPFTIYEANNRIGGNCITLKHGDFLFDSGAHRLHDRAPEVMKELKELLGADLNRIDIPSYIFHQRKLIDFPLSPLNLLRRLGLYTFTKAAFEVILSRLGAKRSNRNFESFALNTYGKTIADLFLLNYSEKLWGAPCNQLSSDIAGTRMRGLNLKTFLTEAIFGHKAKTEHLDGSFYYPKFGIGTISDKLAEFCGKENIIRDAKITKILHNNNRIQAVEINGNDKVDTDEVVSTLPLDYFFQVMEPKLPDEILSIAKGLRYRNMILVTFFLDRESVMEAATIYITDPDFFITRIYEPKNRSRHMSPPGQTSLVAEIPCQEENRLWNLDHDELIRLTCSQLTQTGWIEEGEIIGASVSRLHNAYPILEVGYANKVQKINAFLKVFSNLKLSGRNGRFVYAWIHDMMRFGKEINEEYINNGSGEGK
ncbi:MAG: FAD-dependent oxidoreductase [Deltaproteobacteria bacterium]|nr:MAG: FAD-dependent oxidoreductase [Deltaproteobacteria bacterium]